MLRIGFALPVVVACTSSGAGGGGGAMGATEVSYEPSSLTSTNVQAAIDEVAATATEARDRAVYIKGPTDVDPAAGVQTVDSALPANGRYVITAEGVAVDTAGNGGAAKCTLYVEGQTGWSSVTYFTLAGATPMHMTMTLDAAGNEAFMRWGCEVGGHALFIRGATLTAVEVGNVVHL